MYLIEKPGDLHRHLPWYYFICMASVATGQRVAIASMHLPLGAVSSLEEMPGLSVKQKKDSSEVSESIYCS